MSFKEYLSEVSKKDQEQQLISNYGTKMALLWKKGDKKGIIKSIKVQTKEAQKKNKKWKVEDQWDWWNALINHGWVMGNLSYAEQDKLQDFILDQKYKA